MKKLFAALASAALVGTVFAQTAVPASAMQPQKSAGTQGNEVKAQVSATKEKADAKADAGKSAAKGTHHKAKAAHTKAGMTKPGVAKAATSMDKTKNQ